MAKTKKNETAQAVSAAPEQTTETALFEQEAVINEADGDPIFHADEEAGDSDE